MSLFDRHQTQILDRIHRDEVGKIIRGQTVPPCRWCYDSKTDTYWCEHLQLPGGAVIQAMENGRWKI